MYITISQSGATFKLQYRDFDIDFTHHISYPKSLNIKPADLFKLAIFSRPKNSDYYTIIGTSIDEKHKEFIEKNLNCSILGNTHGARYSPSPIRSLPTNSYLCFSGGFDSIAAKYLLGDQIPMLSVNFMGDFSRESRFFERFEPLIFEWKIRGEQPVNSTLFNENRDWRFLISPGLLLQDSQPLALFTGTILEASPFWFSGRPRSEFSQYYQGILGDGATLISPVSGLSEYGTTLIANRYLSVSDLTESLASLASPNSFKHYRKEVLLAIIKNTALPKRRTQVTKYSFGKNFSEDVISLYILWKAGIEWASENYVDNIPREYQQIDMSYFEKINLENLKFIDPELRQTLLSKMQELGLKIATNDELNNINQTNKFLKNLQTTYTSILPN